jgi:hypothetical protein
MADNFNMKQFLFENKLGAYSKLKTEGEAAYEYEKGKAAGEKLTKEDYAKAEEEKMMDFLAEDETNPKTKKELDAIQKQIVAAQSKLNSFRKVYKDNYSKASKEKQKQLDAALKAAEKDFEKTVTPLEAQSKKLKENKESLNEDASQVVMDLLGTLAGLAGIGLSGVQILRWQDKLEKENPELHKQLGKVSSTIGGADPSKNLEENEESLNEDASQVVMDILGVLAGLAGMGLSGVQILKWQDKLEKENPELHRQLGKVSSTIGGADPSKNLEENEDDGQGIENDIEQDLMYAEDPIFYLKSIIDFCNKKIGEIENEGGDSDMMEAKKEEGYMGTQYDSSEDMAVDMIKKGITEKLTPEMFERMDALTSDRAQIAMIRAAEIMMNELTEEGFEVLDIREYFTQLIANDI